MANYQLDPALQAYIAQSAMFIATDDSLLSRRAAFARACDHFTPAAPRNVTISDDALDSLQVRLYIPAGVPPTDGWPTLLYLHGGGWNMGSHATHDWFAFALLTRVDLAIVAVDYRLAAEHPFPAALDDAAKVWNALRQGHWPQLSRERLSVAGDSAGGLIAASLCVALKDQKQEQPRLQVLVYPVLTDNDELPSMQAHASAPMLTTAGLLNSLQSYLPNAEHRVSPIALPLKQQSPAGLAPAFIGVAEYDPLCDHGLEYAKRLLKAGVPTRVHMGNGLVHASLRAHGVMEVERFYDAIAEAVSSAS